jgi:hypothetical protein
MDKKILKERLNEVKNQLRTNAKDVHFFDKLIDEALSLKGQMGVEPMFAYLPENDIVDRIKGDNYELVYTKTHAGYRLGGFAILVQNHYGLGGQIMNYIDTMKDTSELDEKQKEIFEFDLTASMLNFNAILFAANDFEFRYQLNELVVNYLNKKAEEMNNVEVSEETTEQDREFLATMKAIEALEEANKE